MADQRNTTESITILKDALQTAYKTAAEKHEILEAEVKYLSSLAEKYLAKALEYKSTARRAHDYWTDFLKSHALFNSCAARDEDQRQIWQQKAFDVQQAYLMDQGAIDFDTQQDITNKFLEKLEELRNKIRTETNQLMELAADTHFTKLEDDAVQYITQQLRNEVKDLAAECTADMITFFEELFSDAASILIIEPPCGFAVVAIGSMAKGEVTPYSDLEYFFLIENHSNIEYFETLAMTSYFLIGNLMETKLKYMNISELSDWFEDNYKNGVKIDGLTENAGNIPTGNGSELKRNHFIATVSDFIERCRTTLNDDSHDMSHLATFLDMISHLECIYSYKAGEDLYCELLEKKNAAAFNEQRDKQTIRMICNDISQFNFLPSEDLEGTKRLNTKTELYRYPSILLLDLKNLFHLNTKNSWETLHQLENMCSASFINALWYLFTSCYLIRLTAYAFYDSQLEDISVLTPRQDCMNPGLYYLPKRVFLAVCEIMLPLKHSLHEAISPQNSFNENIVGIESVMKSELKRDEHLSGAITEFYCSNWKASVTCFKQSFQDTDSVAIAQKILEQNEKLFGHSAEDIVYFFVTALFHGQLYDESLEVYQHIILFYDLMPKLTDDQLERLGRAYNGVATSLQKSGGLEDTLQWYEKSLYIRQSLVDKKFPNAYARLADVLSNMSTVYTFIEEYETAERIALEALEIRTQKAYPNTPFHPRLADSYLNLGILHQELERFSSSEQYFKKAIDMRKAVHGNEAVLDIIVDSYGYLANMYDEQGKSKESQDCRREAALLRQQLHPDDDENCIEDLFNQLQGSANLIVGNYNNANSLLSNTTYLA